MPMNGSGKALMAAGEFDDVCDDWRLSDKRWRRAKEKAAAVVTAAALQFKLAIPIQPAWIFTAAGRPRSVSTSKLTR